MIIILPGHVPSKKNSKRIIRIGGRPSLLSSEDFLAWHTASSYLLRQELNKNMAAGTTLKDNTGPFKIIMTLYAENMRAGDLSNKFESIADLFVDNSVVDDDNWFVVNHTEQIFGGIDKENPRVEIEIIPSDISLPKVVKIRRIKKNGIL